MTKIEDGGPAYPRAAAWSPDGYQVVPQQMGLSLRDYFAGQAIASAAGRVCAIEAGEDADEMALSIAIDAYKIADAMLLARKGGNDGE